MLKCLEHLDSIYVACGPTDLRKNVDGLSILVKQSFGLDPFSKSLFLFCNGSKNRLKALLLFRCRNKRRAFSRSARLPQNRKSLREKGSKPRCDCTIAANPSIDLRISV